MSSEERAKDLARAMGTLARNLHYASWEDLEKHAAEVLRAERLAALEEAARECEKISGQTTNGSRATIECAYGQVLAARIRALKGKSDEGTAGEDEGAGL